MQSKEYGGFPSMTAYMHTVQLVVVEIIQKHISTFLFDVTTGSVNIGTYWNHYSVEDDLEPLMYKFWSGLTDSQNDYWNLEQVSPEDKQFVFGRLRKAVIDLLPGAIESALADEYKRITESAAASILKLQKQAAVLSAAVSSADLSGLRETLDDLIHQKVNLEKYQLLLRGTLSDPDVNKRLLPSEAITEAAVSKEPALLPKEELKKLPAEPQEALYAFERKLRGGFVPALAAFINEAEVREKGYDHGDLLRLKKNVPTTPPTYEFELAKKVDGSLPERIQFNYCRIEMMKGAWFVKLYAPFTAQGNTKEVPIKLDDQLFQPNLDEKDVRGYRLKVGDRIDIAFWKNNPGRVKVIWLHRN
jgi:hypothetical protein